MHSLTLLLALLVPGDDDLPIAREPVALPPAKEETHAYRWVQSVSDPDQVHLMDGPKQVGTYRRLSGNFFPFDGKAWANKPSAVPKGAPKVPPKEKALNNTGHDLHMPVPNDCQS